MLVRRYIGRQLAEYYSQPSNAVVGASSSEGVQFASLLGEWHWKRLYRQMYNQQEGQWLTPVELFRPYYSRILANFVAASCQEENASSEIHVVELGGGRGTNANILLSHLQQTKPQLYERMSYTVVDSSPSLHELQREVLGVGEHADKVECVLRDLTDVAENKAPLLAKSNTPTVAIALELLDNLPHDKVRRSISTRTLEQAELHDIDQTEPSNHTMEEVFVPMTDPLLSGVLAKVPLYSGKTGRPAWVPTVACGVLERLAQDRPNSRLVVADFDWLPPPDISSSLPTRRSAFADGEPIITAMGGTDYECYLECPRFCDILFPTNFDRLASFVEKTWGEDATVQIMKQGTFLKAYGISEVIATKSWITGFSPLIHDFGNCSILSVTRQNGNSTEGKHGKR